MSLFEIAVALAAVAFVSLLLNGLWSLSSPHCGALWGYVTLGLLVGAAFLFGGRYKWLETVGAGLLLLYLLAIWLVLASPGPLAYC
jgi:hypothetical protein